MELRGGKGKRRALLHGRKEGKWRNRWILREKPHQSFAPDNEGKRKKKCFLLKFEDEGRKKSTIAMSLQRIAIVEIVSTEKEGGG